MALFKCPDLPREMRHDLSSTATLVREVPQGGVTMILIELAVLLGCIVIGARLGGIALGTVAGIGLEFFVFGFGMPPGTGRVEMSTAIMIVMLAAVRPATALSADGPLNIFNAVAVAADPEAKGRGVLIVANGDIHGARSITKTSTTDVQTFMSPECGLIGVSLYGVNRHFRRPYTAHIAQSEFSVEGVESLLRVDVIYITADVSPDLIDSAVANGAKGLVTAGVGNGNMTAPALTAVKRAVKKRDCRRSLLEGADRLGGARCRDQ